MTIETLTLCNITALEGEHILDFTAEPLHSASLFAITGPTGSGKSTVLDALCVALYDQSPRLENGEGGQEGKKAPSSQLTAELAPNDTRLLLRRGSKVGYCYVTFSAANHRRYEARWTARRQIDGKYAPVERELYEVSAKGKGTLLTQTPEEVDRILQEVVGLDYAQFTHTIVLAQNSFSTFLHAQSEQKGLLLEKLTGTEVYSQISSKIFDFHAEAEAEVARHEAELSGASIDRLSPADLAEKTDRIAQLDRIIADRALQQANIEQLLKWYADYEVMRQQLETATAEHNLINKQYLAMRSEEVLLERYDSIQPFRPLYEQIRENRQRIDGLKADDTETLRLISEEKEKLVEVKKQLIVANERKSDAEKQMRQRRADIDLGHAIEGEILAGEENLSEAERTLEKSQQKYAECDTLLKNQQHETERLNKLHEDLNLRRQTLATHQLMFEQFQAVNEKLHLYNTEMKQNDRAHLEYDRTTRRQSELTKEFSKAEKSLQDYNDRLGALRAARQVHNQAIAHHDSTTLHTTHANAQQRLTQLLEARRLWKRIVAGYEQNELQRATLERRSRQLEQKRNERTPLERDEQQLFERFTRLQKAYTLAQFEDIKRLRTELKEGTPCSLCGSAHHPYHTEVELELGETQSKLEEDYLEAERLYLAKREKIGDLREEVALMEGELKAEREAYEQNLLQQQSLEQEWGICVSLDSSFRDCTAAVNRGARSTTIEMLIDSTDRQLKDSEQLIKTHDFHVAQIKELSEKMERLEAESEGERQRHNDYGVELKAIRTRVELLQRAMVESDARVEQLYKDLDDVLTVSGWRDDDIDEFIRRISELYSEWKRTNTEITRTQKDLAVANAQTQHLTDHLESLRRTVIRNREKRDRQLETNNSKHEQLRRLFGDSTPKLLTEFLQNNVAAATQHNDRIEEENQRLLLNIEKLEGRHEGFLQEHNRQEEILRERMAELDHSIARYNLENAPLQAVELATIFSEPRDWNALRQQLTQCRNELLLATQTKDKAQADFLDLQGQPTRPSDRDEDRPDSLRATQEVFIKEIEIAQEERNVLRRSIERHQDALRNAETIDQRVQAARKNVEEWAKLCEEFGEKDGRRFRDMAQTFTFAILVEHANYYLHQFMPRYELVAIKDSLSLLVKDHDRLGEERNVSSLSGGETFLVSLALSLALSALTTESDDESRPTLSHLFIDEGFGLLDDSTLPMVVQALSRLQSLQGRKVGIVSHAESIRTQVFPQIALLKKGTDGKSNLVVV